MASQEMRAGSHPASQPRIESPSASGAPPRWSGEPHRLRFRPRWRGPDSGAANHHRAERRGAGPCAPAQRRCQRGDAPPPPSTQPPHSHHAPRAPALTHPTHPTRLAPPPLRRAPRPRHALSAQAHTPRPAPPLPPPRTLAAAAALVRSGCWSYICKSQDRTDEYMVDTFTHLLLAAHSLLQLRTNAPQIHSPPEPMLERTLRTKNIGTDIGSILRGEGEMKGGGVRARIGTAAPETDSAHQARP